MVSSKFQKVDDEALATGRRDNEIADFYVNRGAASIDRWNTGRHGP